MFRTFDPFRFVLVAVSGWMNQRQPHGGVEFVRLQLDLRFGEQHLSSQGKSGNFESELEDIHRQLPSGTYLKACFKCLYADYSTSGSGLFGNMLCFRNIKDKYLAVTNKRDFLAIQDAREREVQEIYLCSEFSVRIPGAGYRA